MGTVSKKRKRSSSNASRRSVAPEIRIRNKVSETIRSIFSSPRRRLVYERQRQRFFVETDRIARGMRAPFDIVEIDRQIRQKRALFGSFLSRPPEFFPAALVDSLSSDFLAHFYTIEKMTRNEERNIVVTSRLAEVYTACMCYWLSSGFEVSGIPIVSAHPYFKQHVPPEICFGELGLTCGHMSEFTRSLKRVCCVMTGDGKVRYRYGLKLSLSKRTCELLDTALVIGQRRRVSASTP